MCIYVNTEYWPEHSFKKICQTFHRLKKFLDCFSINTKTAWFVVPFIVLGKFKVFGELLIHPSKILRRVNTARKARRRGRHVV